jgi:hypothetical protein
MQIDIIAAESNQIMEAACACALLTLLQQFWI